MKPSWLVIPFAAALGLSGTASAARAACVPEGCLYCGKTVSGNTMGGTSTLSTYACSDLSLAGPDQFYCFSVDVDTQVRLELTPAPTPAADLALLLLEGDCDGASCVARGDEPGGHETLEFLAFKGRQYYLAVDGHLTGDDAPYQLSATCTKLGTCEPHATIACGETVGDDLGSSGTFDLYAGAKYPKPGPEMIYAFTPDVTGKATLKLVSSSTGMTDLVVLEGQCSPARVVGLAENYWSNETLVLDVVAGTPYFVVVDSRTSDGVGDYFELGITCAKSDVCDGCDSGPATDAEAADPGAAEVPDVPVTADAVEVVEVAADPGAPADPGPAADATPADPGSAHDVGVAEVPEAEDLPAGADPAGADATGMPDDATLDTASSDAPVPAAGGSGSGCATGTREGAMPAWPLLLLAAAIPFRRKWATATRFHGTSVRPPRSRR